MATLKKYKEIILLGVLAAGFAFWLYTIEANASEAKEKAAKVDTILEQAVKIQEQTNQILQDAISPTTWLRNYLVNHNVERKRAYQWTGFPIGPILDSNGAIVPGVPFLDDWSLPDVGILMIMRDSTEEAIDTLWDFR